MLVCQWRYVACLSVEVCCLSVSGGMLLVCQWRYVACLSVEVCCLSVSGGMLLVCQWRYVACLSVEVCCLSVSGGMLLVCQWRYVACLSVEVILVLCFPENKSKRAAIFSVANRQYYGFVLSLIPQRICFVSLEC